MKDNRSNIKDVNLVEGFSMHDIDIPTLRAYRELFINVNPNHVWSKLDDKHFLTVLGGYVIDEGTKKEGLSIAGLLLFGKGESINAAFANFKLEYKEYCIPNESSCNYQLLNDGTWENNLFNYLNIVLPRLTMSCDAMETRAIREAFTNTLIHSCITSNGIITIDKHPNEIVFTSSGKLLMSIEQIYEGGESKTQNKRMQNMLRIIGFGGSIGAGFSLMRFVCDQKGWAMPELIELTELRQVQLTLHTKSLSSDNKCDIQNTKNSSTHNE